jgi:hypothetical protein
MLVMAILFLCKSVKGENLYPSEELSRKIIKKVRKVRKVLKSLQVRKERKEMKRGEKKKWKCSDTHRVAITSQACLSMRIELHHE